MSTPLQHLHKATILTEQMLLAAEKAEWSELTQLAASRTKELEHAFSKKNTKGLDESAKPALEKLIDLNKQVEQLCRNAKQDLETELRRFTQNKQAVAAYKSL
jgi:hypothetical protein